MVRCSLAILAVLVLVGCPGKDREAPRAVTALPGEAPQRPDQVIGGNVVPQSHTVPAGRAAEIRRLFEAGTMSYPIAVVSAQGTQTQFVSPKPVFLGDNRFVIGAPPQIHAAIDQMITAMGPASAPVSSTYELTFWAVEAAAAADTLVPRDLAEIGPMLEKLGALGKRHFKSIDRVAARSRDGAKAGLAGRALKVQHTIGAGPDGIELELELEVRGLWGNDKPSGGPSVQTKLHVPLDQAIVIGDSAEDAASGGAANLMLYVVRARRVD